jgi:thiosulfate/3-mercaptopyruvate sulfurtransferase
VGTTEPIDPLAGHIPTAVSAYHGGNVREDGTLRSPDELLDRFIGLGARDGAVTYCGSGVTSCHNILAMAVAGLPEPRLYPGSWSDWAGAAVDGDTRYAVATGSEPGAAG